MGINDKIAFAKAGYKFPDQPECPAILTATSSIRMPIGSDSGVTASIQYRPRILKIFQLTLQSQNPFTRASKYFISTALGFA